MDLPAGTPAGAGVDARGVLAFVDALERRPGVEPHGLTVVRHGRVVAAGHWAPYRPDAVRLLYSLSKSVTSAAAGLLVGQGGLDPDDRVLDHFPEYADLVTDERVRSWRVRHLLTMSTGHTEDTAAAIFGRPEDPVRCFLQQLPEREPGTVFAYNQGATYTLARIVQRLAGASLVDHLRPRLFDPVGIGPVGWLEDPPGRAIGFSGLHASHDDVVRFGLLHLQRGRWQGRQLLPPGWVDDATRTQIATPGEPNPDWQQGYGYQFWIGRHGYRGDGAYGQFCLVLPEYDALVVLTSATVGMQGVLDEVYRHLLPAFTATPLSGATDAELAERLAGLTLPVPAGGPDPDDPRAWDGLQLTPRDGVCRMQRSLTGVRVARDPDPRGPAWRLTLAEGDVAITVPVRREWRPEAAPVVGGAGTIPVAAAGGFQRNGELRVHVRFLETPHTLVVVARADHGTFRVLWPTIPLHGTPLHALRAPTPLR